MANVLGLDGVRYLLESSASIPLNVFATASSRVPATAPLLRGTGNVGLGLVRGFGLRRGERVGLEVP